MDEKSYENIIGCLFKFETIAKNKLLNRHYIDC
jgi:hypothetical protein